MRAGARLRARANVSGPRPLGQGSVDQTNSVRRHVPDERGKVAVAVTRNGNLAGEGGRSRRRRGLLPKAGPSARPHALETNGERADVVPGAGHDHALSPGPSTRIRWKLADEGFLHPGPVHRRPGTPSSRPRRPLGPRRQSREPSGGAASPRGRPPAASASSSWSSVDPPAAPTNRNDKESTSEGDALSSRVGQPPTGRRSTSWPASYRDVLGSATSRGPTIAPVSPATGT